MDFRLLKGAIDAESGDIAGAISGYGQAKQTEQAQLNFGQKKQAMKDLAKQVGMPLGYENKIEMAKDEDALANVASEIMNTSKSMELRTALKGKLEGSQQAGQLFYDERVGALTEEQKNDPFFMAQLDAKKAGVTKQSYMKDVYGDESLKTVEDVDRLRKLYPEENVGAINFRDMAMAKNAESRQTEEDRRVKSDVNSKLDSTLRNVGDVKKLSEINQYIDPMQEAIDKLAKIDPQDMPTSMRNEFFGLIKLPANELTNKMKSITDKNLLNAIHQARASVRQFLNQYLKAMSGVAVSAQEAERYQYDFGDTMFSSDQSLVATMNSFIDRVNAGLEKFNIYSNANNTYGLNLSDGSKYDMSIAFNERYGSPINQLQAQAERMRSMFPTLDQAFPETPQIIEGEIDIYDDIGEE